jgi:hypothetical protein
MRRCSDVVGDGFNCLGIDDHCRHCVLASVSTVGTTTILVFFIINRSEKINESETERDISTISEG